MITNPEFKDDPKLYVVPEIKYVAFELWQVKAGSIFDNIMLTHDLDEALQFAKDTWGKTIEAEKAMKAKQDVRSIFLFSPESVVLVLLHLSQRDSRASV